MLPYERGCAAARRPAGRRAAGPRRRLCRVCGAAGLRSRRAAGGCRRQHGDDPDVQQDFRAGRDADRLGLCAAGGGRCAEPGAGAVQRNAGVAGGGDRGAGGAGLGGEGPRAQRANTGAMLARGLAAAGVKVWPSEGNFVLADFGTAERAKAADVFLRRRGVIVRPVGAYGLPHCLRITVGTAEEVRLVIEALPEFMAASPRLHG